MHLNCDPPDGAEVGEIWKAPCCGEWFRFDRDKNAAYGVPPGWVRIACPL